MSRSLDFTACIKQDTCPVKDCCRKLTKEEKDWLEKHQIECIMQISLLIVKDYINI